MNRVTGVVLLALALAGCQSAYYAAAEKVGYPKRDILVERVESARDSQADAEDQFESAQLQLMTLIEAQDSELQLVYESVSDEYDECKDAADEVSDRIDAIEDVAEALFDEWEGELDEYTNQSLRADSARKLRQTQSRYKDLIRVMRASEARMEPVLATMKDNVLYLKHNLNAESIARLKPEFGRLDRQIDTLLQDMRAAIARSNEFIETMRAEDGADV